MYLSRVFYVALWYDCIISIPNCIDIAYCIESANDEFRMANRKCKNTSIQLYIILMLSTTSIYVNVYKFMSLNLVLYICIPSRVYQEKHRMLIALNIRTPDKVPLP
jgi:hypothetical protein